MSSLHKIYVKFMSFFKKEIVLEKPIITEIHKDIEQDLTWMIIAKKELGVSEIAGDKNNARIIEYHSKCSLKAKDDMTAWCSAFVTWVLEESKMTSMKSAWARDYLKYGQKLDEPKQGCIVVMERGNGYGHVGFLISHNDNMVTLLGGNQGDSVSYQRYSKSKVLGYRWPH